MSKVKLPSYILPYNKRKYLSPKVRETLKEIERAKSEGDWDKASTLGFFLRNCWWGYKRYKQKDHGK